MVEPLHILQVLADVKYVEQFLHKATTPGIRHCCGDGMADRQCFGTDPDPRIRSKKLRYGATYSGTDSVSDLHQSGNNRFLF
jgi:hypothetical protein